MKCPQLSLTLLAVAILIAATSPAHSQDVRTYRYNDARTGFNAKETTLTPSNVNVDTFGKLFVLSVDGKVDAQPLYLFAVTISGGTHNVLIVVTENDSVYAFDADTGTQYWKITTLKSEETASDDRGCDQVAPTIGITSTPVISRPSGSNGVIYAVAMSKDSSGNYYQRLHALDAATGGELYNGPVAISAKYPGTGDNSSGGYVIFDPSQYKERSGLLLSNGTIYLTWASHCDIRPYTGWIMAYNASDLTQTSVLNVTPNGNEGAIWGSSAGLTMDTLGNIFLLDANGVFDTKMNSSGFPSSGDYGNAFLHLSTKSGLAVADYFEAYNNVNDGDIDLGSGGTLLLPKLKDSSGNTWELAAGAGKDGNLYLVNRASMGKFSSSSNNIYQELSGALSGGMWNSPAYFGGKLYYGPNGGQLLAFQFKNAKLLTSPVAMSANSFAFPGATLSISANNTAKGIVWAVENASSGAAVLHAYSPTNLTELYNTTQATNGRDSFGTANKYAPPIVANGKVYVPTTSGVGVFGLLSAKSR
jgi:putative pyrroloquinoline-quinone binding quinoprotein